ncbi:MAG: alpha/beta hydrolase [Pseudomonadota bacterium]
MPTLTLSEGNSISYDHVLPSDGGHTFCCFNALSGDKGMWDAAIGERVRAAGHGLLTWNFRGQAGSDFTIDSFSADQIVDDAVAVFEAVQPAKPAHVGLSIGGLYAMRAHLRGGAGKAHGIVLINTLRKEGPRLDWVNNAVVRCAETGGLDLMRDLYSPLLMNADWQAANRENFLGDGGYRGLAADDGTLMLLKSGVPTKWDVPYEQIDVPVLSLTGEQDRVFRDPAHIDELSARIANLTREDLPDAGHMIPVERPEKLAAAIVDWMAKAG